VTRVARGGRAPSLLQEIEVTDLAVYRAVAASPTPGLDRGMRRLSQAANRSVLWFGIAGVLATRPGSPRRAAAVGAASIGITSAAVNLAVKRVLPRARPDRVAAAVPFARQVRMPLSTSFPSGHAASAFAFATAVGDELPWLSLPLRLLATAVAYSRVHTGVHYPADVALGATIGGVCGSLTSRGARRLRPQR
jgi:membrane-associated phospholipid phosphatase